MASNILWGHIGSVISAVLAGLAGYILYPLMGRGLESPRNTTTGRNSSDAVTLDYVRMDPTTSQRTSSVVSTYEEVFLDRKTVVVCLTGFFFQ
jgi:hypothetical protein